MQRTLASLKREYETESQKTISDSSWYYRFTPEFCLLILVFTKLRCLQGLRKMEDILFKE
ncbi:Mobile element protein [Methanosarcina barkeri 227]|uniref:Mobile element protein n=1 Tax=Methanosarcina barkeri 227 TaxID=1434106 RepID=A0A0E3LQ88_METBA|nr:Mobile element protein [Methanosarcina barkeri 227]